MRSLRLLCLLPLLCACSSAQEAPPIDEAPVDPPVLPPMVQPNEDVPVSGTVEQLDAWLRGQSTPVEGATVEALGVYGVPPAMTGADGSYQVHVPQNGRIIFSITKPLYLTSYEVVVIGDRYVNAQTAYLASQTYVDAIGAAHNVDPTQYSVVVGRVVDDAAQPVDGAGGFTINGANVRGPYYLNADGTPNAGNNATQAGLFVVFVEVPQPAESIDITIDAERESNGTTYFYGPVTTKVFRRGLALTAVPETGRDVEPPPPVVQDVDFDTQVYPLLLSVNEGGLGCTGCHTNLGGASPAGGMNLYGGPDVAYQSLDPVRYPGRVNVQSPEQSRLLTKPLYEADGVQDHPIFAFLGTNDPQYQIVLSWIRDGANRDPGVVVQTSFYNDVLPLLVNDYSQGGIGCAFCHVAAADNANNAPGKLYFGGEAIDVYNALTQDPARDNGATGEPYRINRDQPAYSLLLTNPLTASEEPHPVKIFYGAEDPRFQALYRWIADGAPYDGN